MRPMQGPEFDMYRMSVVKMMDDMRAKIAAGDAASDKYQQFLARNVEVKDDAYNGIFSMCRPFSSIQLHIMASNGGGWDHVSVSSRGRCPLWEEMDWIKRKFFYPFETAMQLHVPDSEHLSIHPFTLHLWRPHKETIPRPPGSMV